ncbi:MAG: TetR/AcrR family transcriptional regulator [Myxococcales bacterium]|nr:TetR/AcrR family transcriptional regulator [Myxococcales bacterium]
MPRPQSDIPERLLEAARLHFLAQGVDGASLRAIAKEAGTSIGMIYYHYETKDALFQAVVRRVYQPLLVDLRHALDDAHAPEERLRLVFRRLGKLKNEELEVVRLILREAMINSERLAWMLGQVVGGHLPLILQAFADGARAGTFRDDLPPAAMLIATGSLGLFAQVVRRRIPPEVAAFAGLPPSEELAEALLSILLAGLQKRPEAGG